MGIWETRRALRDDRDAWLKRCRFVERERRHLELRNRVLEAALAQVQETNRSLEQDVQTLTAAIRAHRDQRGDDRRWRDDLALYRVLEDGAAPDLALSPEPEFLESCRRF